MVLVEVCETIIEQNRRAQIRRERELECAYLGGYVSACEVLGGGVGEGPFRGVSVGEGGFEGGGDELAGDGLEGVCGFGALGVVDDDLLDPGRGPQEEAADGAEDEAKGEEEWEDCFGGEDGSGGVE